MNKRIDLSKKILKRLRDREIKLDAEKKKKATNTEETEEDSFYIEQKGNVPEDRTFGKEYCQFLMEGNFSPHEDHDSDN